MENKKLQKLTVSAVMVALATVLSFVKIIEMPYGGSVTLFSMLPVAIVSVMYGVGWGLGAGFVSSLIQFFISLPKIMGWGLTPVMLVGTIFLDYIVPFTIIGLAGIFRKKGMWGMCLGTALAVALRFVSHFLSGVILWANVEKFIAFGKEWINHPYLYSLCYNGTFMLPELVITVVGMFLILRFSAVKKMVGLK